MFIINDGVGILTYNGFYECKVGRFSEVDGVFPARTSHI